MTDHPTAEARPRGHLTAQTHLAAVALEPDLCPNCDLVSEWERLRAKADALADLMEVIPNGDLLDHRFEGRCPDQSQPNSRDPKCHACRVLSNAKMHAQDWRLRDEEEHPDD